jgi:hypothetical protein
MKLISFEKNEAGELQDIRAGRPATKGGFVKYHGMGLRPSEVRFLKNLHRKW